MISNTDELQKLYEQAKTAEIAALDTEFVWERTYYPILGLLQLGWGRENNYLIDIPEVQDPSPIASLMEDASIVKILHDAPQDLGIIYKFCGSLPTNVFDTRLAAGFAGMSSTLSLAALVEEFCGITLDKSATRTNWLKRPLDPVQLEYAIDDVKYLPEIREILLDKLNDQQRSWFNDECLNCCNASNYSDIDPALGYKRVKGTKDVPQEHQGVLMALGEWREREAQTSDRPRGHVIHDRQLVHLARFAPDNEAKIKEAMSKMPGQVKRHQPILLDVIVKGLAMSGPKRDNSKPRIDRNRLKAAGSVLRKLADERATEVGIDPMLIGSRKDLEDLFYVSQGSEQNGTRLLKGWRKDLIGDELLEKAALL